MLMVAPGFSWSMAAYSDILNSHSYTKLLQLVTNCGRLQMAPKAAEEQEILWLEL
jgi:hypothetical protein